MRPHFGAWDCPVYSSSIVVQEGVRYREVLMYNGPSWIQEICHYFLYSTKPNLAIWLPLFIQRRMQFKPIKRRLFCSTGGQEQ